MAPKREQQEIGGFATRLRVVIDHFGNASALAKAIRRSEGAVRKWLRGESEPNVTDLRSLCEVTLTNIEWLVTGRGDREADLPGVREADTPYQHVESVNYGLLEGVLAAVDEELTNIGLTLPSTKRSMLAVTLYDMCRERKEVDREAVARLVKLAV